MPAADVTIAPLEAGDVAGVVRVVEEALPPSGPPEPPGSRHARTARRLERALAGDPDGAWVARADGEAVGVALALCSDGIWALSLLAVSPLAQSGGLGSGLLAHALRYADGCRAAMIASSQDARAMRTYARAGFDLRPCVAAGGQVDRAALPAGLNALVVEASVDDVERTVPVDVAVRGGGRPAHLAEMLAIPDVRLYLVGKRGYAVGREGRVLGLAATDEEAAQALLWRLLAETPANPAGEAGCERVTAGQDWAVGVVLRAGLALRTDGPIFTRGQLGTLRPFLPTAGYL